MGDKKMIERGGYLPGLSVEEVEWQALYFDGVGSKFEIQVPLLSEDQVRTLTTSVRNAARTKLKAMPVAQIIEIIDCAINRLLDRNDPYRKKCEEILPLVTGYDAEMIRLGLTGYLKTFRKPELQKFLVEDFTNPTILDDFQPVPKGGYARAYGPDLLTHIWSGNVPGLPIWSMISGLLVKAGNIGKVPSAEPLFAGWFAEAIAAVAPEISDCFAVVWWKGGNTRLESILLEGSEAVLAYGGNDALKSMRDRTPITTRFLAYGHKVGFGMISKDALDIQKGKLNAHKAAYDVMRYDQHGCYSPHVFFVERGGKVSPQEFAEYLAHELDVFESKYPRRSLSDGDLNNIAAWRNEEEIKSFDDPAGGLIGSAGNSWSVAFVDHTERLTPSSLNRTIKVVAVDALAEVVPLIAPYKTTLQTVGISASPDQLFNLSNSLALSGVTRVSALGCMTKPEAGWHHDGRFNLLDLVTLTEIEQSAIDSADTLATFVD